MWVWEWPGWSFLPWRTDCLKQSSLQQPGQPWCQFKVQFWWINSGIRQTPCWAHGGAEGEGQRSCLYKPYIKDPCLAKNHAAIGVADLRCGWAACLGVSRGLATVKLDSTGRAMAPVLPFPHVGTGHSHSQPGSWSCCSLALWKQRKTSAYFLFKRARELMSTWCWHQKDWGWWDKPLGRMAYLGQFKAPVSTVSGDLWRADCHRSSCKIPDTLGSVGVSPHWNHSLVNKGQ